MKTQKALFFDRDGVINKDFGYVFRVSDFEFYDDFFAVARRFKKRGYKLIVITNQSGIDRGYFSVLDFLALCKYMQGRIFDRLGFCMDRIYFAPFLNDNVLRKPAPGMILKAANDFNLNLSECVLVGDNLSDIKAGFNAGIQRLYLLNRNFKDSKNIESKSIDFRIINTLDALH